VPPTNAHRNDLVPHQGIGHVRREHADVEEFMSEADDQMAADAKCEATLPHTTNGPIRSPLDSDGSSEQGYRAHAT
jgi:hypothetical protein